MKLFRNGTSPVHPIPLGNIEVRHERAQEILREHLLGIIHNEHAPLPFIPDKIIDMIVPYVSKFISTVADRSVWRISVELPVNIDDEDLKAALLDAVTQAVVEVEAKHPGKVHGEFWQAVVFANTETVAGS